MPLPDNTGPRLAARALILIGGRLLLVNAYPGDESDLWCAPGGGVERHVSIPDNLAREVHEETGLTIAVGVLAGVNEFHDPASGFHQVELFFRTTVLEGGLDDRWRDPDGIVNRRRLFARSELPSVRFKPDSLAALAYSEGGARYDPLEPLVR